jgi:hypothetical protein
MKFGILTLGFIFLNLWAQEASAWSCNSSNDNANSVEDITDIVTACSLKKVEDVIPLLPSEMRSQYALAYVSRSPMSGSYDNPRVIKFTKSGLAVTYNGQSDENLFNSLEMLSFDEGKKEFHLKSIEFSPDEKQAPVIGQTNPALCLSCHGDDPRPIFDEAIWPGFYGSMANTQLIDNEVTHMTSFLAKAKLNPRYNDLHFSSAMIDIGGDIWKNLFDLTQTLYGLNGHKIAYKISQIADVHPFRYALIGIVSCGLKPSDLIDPKALSKFSKSYTDVSNSSVQLEIESELKHFDRELEINGSIEEGAAFYNDYKNPTSGFLLQQADSNSSLTGVRYIVEGLGHDMSTWAANLFPQYYTMEGDPDDEGQGISGDSEFYKSLLDPVKDAAVFRPDPDCNVVKKMSLAETSQ